MPVVIPRLVDALRRLLKRGYRPRFLVLVPVRLVVLFVCFLFLQTRKMLMTLCISRSIRGHRSMLCNVSLRRHRISGLGFGRSNAVLLGCCVLRFLFQRPSILFRRCRYSTVLCMFLRLFFFKLFPHIFYL